jgi:hypothetical protein
LIRPWRPAAIGGSHCRPSVRYEVFIDDKPGPPWVRSRGPRFMRLSHASLPSCSRPSRKSPSGGPERWPSLTAVALDGRTSVRAGTEEWLRRGRTEESLETGGPNGITSDSLIPKAQQSIKPWPAQKIESGNRVNSPDPRRWHRSASAIVRPPARPELVAAGLRTIRPHEISRPCADSLPQAAL